MPSNLVPFSPSDPLPTAETIGSLRTTLDLESTTGKRLAIRCKIGEDFGAEALIGEKLNVIGIVQHPQMVRGRDGEDDRLAIRTVLILSDGARVSSVSQWVAESLEKIMQCGMVPSEAAPLSLVFKEGTSRNRGRKFHYVDLAD